ncbi:MAG: acyl-CoA desaturase [Patescibacteria group bacterium]
MATLPKIESELGNPYEIDWLRSIPFFAMHLACFAVIWVGWSWVAVSVAFGLYWFRMFAVTGIYHRYFSHRTYKTSRVAQFFMALWGGTCTQKGPLWWAAHHRHHHRHSDDPDDPHSPHEHSFPWAHMGWINSRRNAATNYQAVPDLAKFPELVFLNRFDTLVPVLLAVSLFCLGKALSVWRPEWETSGWQMLIWGFFISTVVLFHATSTINSLAHLMGRKRYDTRDESRNSFFLAIITMGEGWHNNHHHYPATVRQGFYWWEIDLTYYILRLFEKLGIIWDMNPLPDAHRENGKIAQTRAPAT